MLTGETPARAFLDWAHFFLLVSEETGLAVLAGFFRKGLDSDILKYIRIVIANILNQFY